ncbi:CAP domain-containing protein [Streptomyces colonosanans]|uniref:SCP-like protein n=1 Tax=Streptomyces colonosanans TaxID=1428652 RepID=A0A1S2P7G7_9ACTN|nr:CAP domain-containing protein [Streptomyces colonosanans]OIJ89618.1 SCP-like protein [Streptomyces colonosanans]
MGRHRRADAGRAEGGTQKRDTSTERYGPENLYGFAAVLEDERRATRSRRRKKAAAPVRTGLLGVSAAVALGTVAVATGVLPGGNHFKVSGDPGHTRAGGITASGSETEQGGTNGTADDRGSTSTSRHSGRTATPTATPSMSASSSASASASPAIPAQRHSRTPSSTASKTTSAPPTQAATKKPKTVPTGRSSAATTVEGQVIMQVNQERAKVGCRPVSADGDLTRLAEAFSADMAARDFFDHTDPSGNDPWDRAKARGITGLGGENIARGQATAQSVMDAWMHSPGHRANILNCDFTTLGVGVHFETGGPWWTQDFGY